MVFSGLSNKRNVYLPLLQYIDRISNIGLALDKIAKSKTHNWVTYI